MVELKPLEASDKEQFIKDNQEAFNYGALEEFGMRDNHFEEDEQIISRETIENSIAEGEAYRIVVDGKNAGGLVLRVEGTRGDLDLLFVSPKAHSKGIGYAAWCEVEKLYPQVTLWETVTPYFKKRDQRKNIGNIVALNMMTAAEKKEQAKKKDTSLGDKLTDSVRASV